MGRFSGRKLPGVKIEEDLGDEGTLTVQVKAHLTMNIWIESLQRNDGGTILVTDSHYDEDTGSEVLTGVDGVTGLPMEIRITALK